MGIVNDRDPTDNLIPRAPAAAGVDMQIHVALMDKTA